MSGREAAIAIVVMGALALATFALLPDSDRSAFWVEVVVFTGAALLADLLVSFGADAVRRRVLAGRR